MIDFRALITVLTGNNLGIPRRSRIIWPMIVNPWKFQEHLGAWFFFLILTFLFLITV